MCKRHVLPQIAQITQRNAASCIISQRKTVCSLSDVGVSSALSARSAGDIGVSLMIDGVLLCEYSPADSADHAEECSKLHYFAEKDRLVSIVVLGFRGLSA